MPDPRPQYSFGISGVDPPAEVTWRFQYDGVALLEQLGAQIVREDEELEDFAPENAGVRLDRDLRVWRALGKVIGLEPISLWPPVISTGIRDIESRVSARIEQRLGETREGLTKRSILSLGALIALLNAATGGPNDIVIIDDKEPYRATNALGEPLAYGVELAKVRNVTMWKLREFVVAPLPNAAEELERMASALAEIC